MKNLFQSLLPIPNPNILGDYRAKRQLKNIFPDNPELWHCVYLIGSKKDLKALRLSKLYVGESHQPEQRLWDHRTISNKNRKLFKAMHEFGWTIEDNLLIIFYGTHEQCLRYEAELRPIGNMGLNTNAGGRKHMRDFGEMTPRQAAEFAKECLTWQNCLYESEVLRLELQAVLKEAA